MNNKTGVSFLNKKLNTIRTPGDRMSHSGSSNSRNQQQLTHHTNTHNSHQTAFRTNSNAMFEILNAETIDEGNIFDTEFTDENLLLTNQQLLLTNQQRLLQNQLRIMHQITRLEKLMNRVIDNVTVSQHQVEEQSPPPKVRRIVRRRSTSPAYERIDSLEQINELEEKLKDSEYKKLLEDKMTLICGENGKMNGINCSYILVDHFFTRRFMTMCSWAGGSRNSEGKIPFKIYENVMNLFHSLVQKADRDFSMIHCQQFFKSVIKNSTRRNITRAVTRASRTKCRPRKMEYNKRSIKLHLDENGKDEPMTDENSMEQHIDSYDITNVNVDRHDDNDEIFVKTESNISLSNNYVL